MDLLTHAQSANNKKTQSQQILTFHKKQTHLMPKSQNIIFFMQKAYKK